MKKIIFIAVAGLFLYFFLGVMFHELTHAVIHGFRFKEPYFCFNIEKKCSSSLGNSFVGLYLEGKESRQEEDFAWATGWVVSGLATGLIVGILAVRK